MSAGKWDRVADTYSSNINRFTTLHAADIISAVPQIRTAKTILEVACGPGAFANAYLNAFPKGIPGQTVILSDFSQGMVDATCKLVDQKIGKGCATEFKFQVIDGRDMNQVSDGSVDVVVSVFGVFLIGGPVMDEVYRVLKKGGIFANASWTDVPAESSLEDLGFGFAFQRTMGATTKALIDKSKPSGPWEAWSGPEAVREIFAGVMLKDVKTFKTAHSVGFDGVEQIWELLKQSPIVDYDTIGDDQIKEAKEALRKAVKAPKDEIGGIIFLLTSALIAIGTK